MIKPFGLLFFHQFYLKPQDPQACADWLNNKDSQVYYEEPVAPRKKPSIIGILSIALSLQLQGLAFTSQCLKDSSTCFYHYFLLIFFAIIMICGSLFAKRLQHEYCQKQSENHKA